MTYKHLRIIPAFRITKSFNLKRQKNLLKNNETVYHDKVPISTRFYLQLLKKSQFLKHFTDTETYEYASESEKPINSPEPLKNKAQIKKEAEKTTYNLRSSEGKTERKVYEKPRTRRIKVQEKAENDESKALERKRKNRKEPLAPIIEEIKSREPLKTVKGTEIDKIAEKLKSLVKNNNNDDAKDLLNCKETFDKENIEGDNEPLHELKKEGSV